MDTMKVESVEEMGELAAAFVASLRPKKEKAAIIGLSGELGSGKTTFVQHVARALGVRKTITSPTFVILKQYEVCKGQFRQLVHVDAYRLENADELTKLSWDIYIRDPENLILVEWPEHVMDALPSDTPIAQFTFIDDTTREIILQ